VAVTVLVAVSITETLLLKKFGINVKNDSLVAPYAYISLVFESVPFALLTVRLMV